MIDFERIFRERIGVEQFLMMAGRNDAIANHVIKYGEMHHWSHEQMAVAVARAWYQQLTHERSMVADPNNPYAALAKALQETPAEQLQAIRSRYSPDAERI